ncbi:MAG TPA: phosphatidylserine decarboxylase [Candidatus Binataceae bacterium]|nr:phosphatidylserine decarboxylase [Candidatus Binataceae bacterium]
MRQPTRWFDRPARRIGIAGEGAIHVLIPIALAAAAIVFGVDWLAIILLVVALAFALFFRDPERLPAGADGVVLSGADGRVCDLGEGSPPGLPDQTFRRVSVFMSPLDVHVNRAPVGGEVLAVTHTPGEFHAAYSDVASQHNERNLVVIRDAADRRYVFVQVAGYLARRIVCRVRPQDRVFAGDRIGLIMFGSRFDHFLPMDYQLTVAIGDRVRGGETVIGELKQ